MRRLWGALTIAAACAAAAPCARAESGEAARVEAERRFARGMELVAGQRWTEALAEFDASLAALPTQTALYNRALCLRLLGRDVEAVRALEEHVDRYGATVDDARRAEVERELALLRGRVGRLAVRVEGAAGAVVSVDGVEVGRTPLPHAVVVEPGEHEVAVAAVGASPLRQSVQVAAGAEVPVVVALAATPPEPPDDATHGPGVAPVAGPEPRRHRGAWIGAWVSAGLAAAGLGTALGLFLWNRGEFESWDAQDDALRAALEPGRQPADFDLAQAIEANDELGDQIGAASAATWAMLAVGAAGAVTAATLFALAPRLGRRQAALLPTPGGLALAATW